MNISLISNVRLSITDVLQAQSLRILRINHSMKTTLSAQW